MTRTDLFHFDLPPVLIAQVPAAERDQSRLLVLDRTAGSIEHRRFRELKDFLNPGDLLVLNDSRVIPARLRARKAVTGGLIEILLLEENRQNDWWVMLRPAKRVRSGSRLEILNHERVPSGVEAVLLEKNREGECRLEFSGAGNIAGELDRLGEVPLPPYIERHAQDGGVDDAARYQTIFAKTDGSVAAPTAALHITPEFLSQVRDRGVGIGYVTLHVGLGTFAPVKAPAVEEHRMHAERFTLPEETAEALRAVKRRGGRVVAVGTTTVRVLESVASAHHGNIPAAAGRTRIFIYPPFRFQVVDALLTNFHLPCSTLLMLVSAFAAPGELRGRELVLSAYGEAVRERYRFFSYGDAMFLKG